jgi:Protein of unknown function (DUF2959)
MKTNKLRILGAGLTLTVLLAGCKTHSNYETAGDTAEGLQASADRVERTKGQLDSVLAALNDLVNGPTNLPTQYTTFSSAVTDLEASGKNVNDRVTAMRAKGAEYFKSWNEEVAKIKNEDIKSRSAEREKEVQDQFTKVKLSYTEAGDAYRPFMSDLKDIQTALGTDLTAGGVAAIKGAAEKANKDAIPLKKAGDDLSAQLKELGAAMSTSGPAPAPAPK